MRLTPFAGIERRLPRPTTAVLAVACATVFGGSGAVAIARAGGEPTPGASPAPIATPTPGPATPRPARTIADLLLPLDEAIPRYDRESDTTTRTGPIDVTRAAQLGSGSAKPTAADKREVQRLGFVRGYSRAFADASQLVVIYVYEWRTPAQAKAYAVSAPHLQRAAGRWRPGPPSANGSCRIRDGLAIDTVTMVVGRHTFTTTDIRDGNCQSHTEAATIATLQYAHAVPLRS